MLEQVSTEYFKRKTYWHPQQFSLLYLKGRFFYFGSRNDPALVADVFCFGRSMSFLATCSLPSVLLTGGISSALQNVPEVGARQVAAGADKKMDHFEFFNLMVQAQIFVSQVG